MDWTITPFVIALIALVIGFIVALLGAVNKKSTTRKGLFMFGLPVMAIALIIVVLAVSSGPTSWFNKPMVGNTANFAGQTITYSNVPMANNNQNPASSITTYQPTASYSTKDRFSTSSIPGTSYYKVNGKSATTTAYTSVNKGDSITYWVSNSTTYVEPLSQSAGDGVTRFDNTNAYQNGSMTVTGYDLVQKTAITSGAYNSSMGANKNAQIEFTVLGLAKTSNIPLGGVMVVEYNSTIPTVSCSGDGIVGLNNKYQVTYSVTATTNAFKIYEVAKGFDVSQDGGNTGVTRNIRCDFTNGASAVGTGSPFYVKFIPANYYLGNDGNIYLDVEQKMNGATTRTNLGGTLATFYWGA